MTVPTGTKVLIYLHGTTRPHRMEDCRLPRNAVPGSLRRIGERPDWEIYFLCSRARDGDRPGSYIPARVSELRAVLAALEAAGVPAWDIFLGGHSAGAWTALMAMGDAGRRFNAAVLFAPACCGPRAERARFPVWRESVRPAQIAEITAAPGSPALVIAFPDDPFNRPADLFFLTESFPDTLRLAVPDCGTGHQSHLGSCANDPALDRLISDFLDSRTSSGGT